MSVFRDPTDRLRGRKAQRRRLRVWTVDPYCAMCGRLTVYPDGFELDHRVPLFKGGADTDGNLQVLCPAPCHEDKTRADLGQKVKQAVGVDGWAVEPARQSINS